MSTERRSVQTELRAKGRKLEGYAAVFDTRADLGSFTEVIKPGAFTDSLGDDILGLIDHDRSRLLARTKNKTLRLAEDSRGLQFEIDVPDTSAGRDILTLAERGDLGGASFGFTVAKDGETWKGTTRELRAVQLHEISVVQAWPAYEGTVVSARAKVMGEPLSRRLARVYLELLR